TPSPSPEFLFGKLAERSLEPVLVPAADRLAPLQLPGEPGELRKALRDPVLLVASARGEGSHVGEPLDHLRKLRASIEGLMLPRGVEIAVLGEGPGSVAQGFPRIHPIAPALAAAQRSPDAFARCRELALEPGIEGLVEQRRSRLARGQVEERVDARLDRPLAQEVGAEGVDGADLRD